MAAYNRLQRRLRTASTAAARRDPAREWGFDGVVISDWFATHGTVDAANAGLDLEMPGPPRHYGAKLADAVRKRRAPRRRARRRRARRILALLARTGALDEADRAAPSAPIDRPEHRAIAREAAAEAIVLLKNDADALPLDDARATPGGDRPERGPRRDPGRRQRTRPPTLRGVAARRASARARASGRRGRLRARLHQRTDHARARQPHFSTDRSASSTATARGRAARPCACASRATCLPGSAPRLGRREAAVVGVGAHADVTPAGVGRAPFSLVRRGKSRLLIDGRLVVDNWSAQDPRAGVLRARQRGGEGGRRARGGPQSRSRSSSRRTARAMPGGLRLGCLPPSPPTRWSARSPRRRDADAAVVVVGLDREWETEGRDRDGPPPAGPTGRADRARRRGEPAHDRRRQRGLADRDGLARARLRRDRAALVPRPGERQRARRRALRRRQSLGSAAADVPARMEDTPAFLDVPGENGRIVYGEGLFVGHRWYDASEIAPRFAFGHGLSYARFEYTDLRLARDARRDRARRSRSRSTSRTRARARARRSCSSTCATWRRGSRAPRRSCARSRRSRSRRASAHGALRARRARSVVLGPRGRDWVAEPGAFELRAGASSRDLRAGASFTLEAATP